MREFISSIQKYTNKKRFDIVPRGAVSLLLPYHSAIGLLGDEEKRAVLRKVFLAKASGFAGESQSAKLIFRSFNCIKVSAS